jgi:hypothetical protein
MKIVITGATGFIGGALCEKLKNDYEIIALSRNPKKASLVLDSSIKITGWDGKTCDQWKNELEGAFGVINLAGENISDGKWTPAKKDRILNSRINATAAVVEAIRQVENKPKILMQASAMGWYGSGGFIEADEGSPPGEGFLADVCRQWEKITEPVENMGVRVVKLRLGAVIGKQGGILPMLMKVFRFLVGGYIGTGQQYISWVSIDDVTGAVRFLMENENCGGAFNITAPAAVTMKEFCKALGKAMKRPSWTAMPGFAAKLMYGEMAEELLLASYKIRPKRLLDCGYEFKYPILQEALNNLVNRE